MPWEKPERQNRELFEYTRRLIGFRRMYPALRRGSYRALHAREGLYAFARELPGECFVVALNVNRHPVKLEISTAALPALNGECRDLLNGYAVHVAQRRLTGYELPARSGALFRHETVR
jgi:glycosidase